jgi:hypothetical protein
MSREAIEADCGTQCILFLANSAVSAPLIVPVWFVTIVFRRPLLCLFPGDAYAPAGHHSL